MGDSNLMGDSAPMTSPVVDDQSYNMVNICVAESTY